MNKVIGAVAVVAILGGSLVISTPTASAQQPEVCYSISVVHEARYKRVIAGEKETFRTEYRFRSRTKLHGSKEVKYVKGYDFVGGGTTKVDGQTVAGHWVKSEGWHQIPDVIINIVWGAAGVPENLVGGSEGNPKGSVPLTVYGGPSVSVPYYAEKVETDAGYTDWGPWSDWSTDDPGGDTSTREVDSRKVGNGDATPDETSYYLPGGGESSTLGEANWTTDLPGEKWTFIDQRDREIKVEVECPPPPPPAATKVTLKVQVDKYSTSTKKLRSKAAGYDNDGKLKKGEDRPHYGKSSWEIVTVTGTTETTKAEWLAKINKATKKVPNLTSSSKWSANAAKGRKSITVAWIISGDGKPTAWYYEHTKTNVAQRFFASNR